MEKLHLREFRSKTNRSLNELYFTKINGKFVRTSDQILLIFFFNVKRFRLGFEGTVEKL